MHRMGKISFDDSHLSRFLHRSELSRLQDVVNVAHAKLHEKTGQGNEYLGWLDWPKTIGETEMDRILKAANTIREHSDVLLVIGIGGSYIGARAAIDMLNPFFNSFEEGARHHPRVIFVGHHLHAAYITELLHYLNDKDVSINVISKSGTTTEPAIAFRIFRKWLEVKYGKEEAKTRIYVTTDKQKGGLKRLSDQEGYETFAIPDDIGGRYSVLTAVGLLPIATSGIDICDMITGARDASEDLVDPSLERNPAYQYAASRSILYQKGKLVELLVMYNPAMQSFAEWWKQLFAESEGKDGKGIFPVSTTFTTDLHSIGQYIQAGRRLLFETVLAVEHANGDVAIEWDEQNVDNLNYLVGKTVQDVNDKAMEASIAAHTEGGVPNLIIRIPALTPYHVGYLFYFFEKACALSAYLLGVNPFDQPDVEAYKTAMFRLLGKPGYTT